MSVDLDGGIESPKAEKKHISNMAAYLGEHMLTHSEPFMAYLHNLSELEREALFADLELVKVSTYLDNLDNLPFKKAGAVPEAQSVDSGQVQTR